MGGLGRWWWWFVSDYCKLGVGSAHLLGIPMVGEGIVSGCSGRNGYGAIARERETMDSCLRISVIL